MYNYIDKQKRISDTIKMLLDETTVAKFAIYPFGSLGVLTKRVLDMEFGIEEILVVDNELSKYNKKIYSLNDIKGMDLSDYIFLLVSDNECVYAELRRGLYGICPKDQIIDVFSISPLHKQNGYFDKTRLSKPRYASWELCAKEIYKNNVQGSVAEVGVYRGESAKILNRLFCDRKLHLFDTFNSFDKQEFQHDFEHGFIEERRFNEGHEKLKDTNPNLVMDKMAFPSNVIIHEGFFPDTASGIEDDFCFVSLDVDLYKPTLAGLEYFYPKIQGGGTFLFMISNARALFAAAPER